jgi:hypothetical protein
MRRSLSRLLWALGLLTAITVVGSQLCLYGGPFAAPALLDPGPVAAGTEYDREFTVTNRLGTPLRVVGLRTC